MCNNLINTEVALGNYGEWSKISSIIFSFKIFIQTIYLHFLSYTAFATALLSAICIFKSLISFYIDLQQFHINILFLLLA